MAAHSNVFAWRSPGTAEPGGRLSMGSQSRTRLKQLSSSSSTHINSQLRSLSLVVSHLIRPYGLDHTSLRLLDYGIHDLLGWMP